MAGEPAISVIIPSYNGERFVAETLRSVQAQTRTDFEVVVVDDGSAAATRSILHRFADEDGRIRVVEAAHGGLVATLNRALGEARGAYVARLDHDDIAEPERLVRQAAVLDADRSVVAVACDIGTIGADGVVLKKPKHKRQRLNHQPLAFPPRLVSIPGSTLMARADALRAAGGYRQACYAAEDRDIAWRLGDLGPVHRIAEVLVYWRTHGANTSTTRRLTQMASHAIGDLSAVARRLGRDDTAIIARVQPGGDYAPVIAAYRTLLEPDYPVETYWLYVQARHAVWPLGGHADANAFKAAVRAHVLEKPTDWRRLKLAHRALTMRQPSAP